MDNDVSAPKKDSEKIILLFACSMVGEKLPLCILGKSSQPRCFSKYDMDTLDILYGSNKAAWMIKDSFSEWLSHIIINDFF